MQTTLRLKTSPVQVHLIHRYSMVAAKRKAITEIPKQQYNYKRLQNKEVGLRQLLQSNPSLLFGH
jgi:hypothetical protein